MSATLRRLHVWVGLFALTSLAVMAFAGLHASFAPAAEPAPVETREVPFEAGRGLSDLELAVALHRQLRLPLTATPRREALRRDPAGRLVVWLWTPNGGYRVTLLESQRAARVERLRNSLGAYLNLMHSQLLREARPGLPARLWGAYVDASIAALAFLAVSGLWLWLASRPRLAWARAAFAAGTLAVGALLWAIR